VIVMLRREIVLGLTAAALLAAGYIARSADPPQNAASANAASAHASETQATLVWMAKSYRFDPLVIEIPAGTTLTWVNDDNFTHNVQFTGGLQWTSPAVRPGESTSYTFDVPGTYDYLCVFHSHNMRGQIVVLARSNEQRNKQ
jgi:plastocyanin